MKSAIFFGAAAALLCAPASGHPSAMSTPYDTDPTALEVYDSCRIMMELPPPERGPSVTAWQLNAYACEHLGTEAIFRPPVRWCAPDSEGISVEDYRPMIQTYLRYFEQNLREFPANDGHTAFFTALSERWPCSGNERR
jgi:hypothetical protein